jgi:hypothetical protein
LLEAVPLLPQSDGLDDEGLGHDGTSSSHASSSACGLESVLSLLHDVAAPFGREDESELEEKVALCVLAGPHALEYLHCDVALKEFREGHQSGECVAAEAVDFLNAEHVSVAEVLEGSAEAWPLCDGELA